MLIAIMGDTFDEIMENQERFALAVCPDIYADYLSLIWKRDEFKKDQFLYVIDFVDSQVESDWQGHIKELKRTLHHQEVRFMDSID